MIYVIEKHPIWLFSLSKIKTIGTAKYFIICSRPFLPMLALIKGKAHPHALRHFFAKSFYDKTHDLVMLSNILGHSDISTTKTMLPVRSKNYATKWKK